MDWAFVELLNEFVRDYRRGRQTLSIWFWSVEILGLLGVAGGLLSGKFQGVVMAIICIVGMMGTYVSYCVFKAVLMMRDRMSLAAEQQLRGQK
jgi:hypothetical protein